MLSTLRIENIAVIEFAEIEFDGGFCVLTGETGAGKSILIDSLGAVLGNRTSRDLVRTGSEKASVSALFTDCTHKVLGLLSELGYASDDRDVLLSRTITADGRSSCRINGLPATTAILRQVSGELVNIHGQQDNHVLLDPAGHYVFVDRMAGDEALLERYKTAFARLKALEKEKARLDLDDAEKERRVDMLRFQIDELNAANIQLGEQAELEARRSVLQNSEKIAAALANVCALLSGGDDFPGGVELVQRSAGELSPCADYMEEIKNSSQRLTDLGYELDEIYEDIRSLAEQAEYNPSELAEIEERLDALHRLSRKYGGSEEEMLLFLERAQTELAGIQQSDARFAQLDGEIADARGTAGALAEQLTDIRRKTAEKMAAAIGGELEFLNMPNVTFVIDRKPCELNPTGGDKIEFLISANAGELPKPLSKIASGGELSRIMLAILSVLMDQNSVATLVFDEIDAGISGRAADKVGVRLKKTASGRQVICITHLAQIAAKSDSHYLIEKNVAGGRTVTTVTRLSREGRVDELARIIGGSVVTETTRQTALELLDSGGRQEQ